MEQPERFAGPLFFFINPSSLGHQQSPCYACESWWECSLLCVIRNRKLKASTKSCGIPEVMVMPLATWQLVRIS